MVHALDWTRGLFQNRKTGLLSSRKNHDVFRMDVEVELPVFLRRNASPLSYQRLITDFDTIDELVAEKSAGSKSCLQNIGICCPVIFNNGQSFRAKTDQNIFPRPRTFSDAQPAYWRFRQRRSNDLSFQPIDRSKKLRHLGPCRAMVQFHGTADLQQRA